MVIYLATAYLTYKTFGDSSGFDDGLGGLVKHSQEILNVGQFAMDIGAVFNEIWTWLLYNLLTPIILIAFLILFFVGQYYLIKAYFFIIRKSYVMVSTLSNKILQTERGSKFISGVLEPFDDFRR